MRDLVDIFDERDEIWERRRGIDYELDEYRDEGRLFDDDDMPNEE